ncbi:MAG: hypothetical protein IPL40_11680 [Proteobacteria bacterium]|nr:hypothetical protein [Pseudomonadota bacterium]
MASRSVRARSPRLRPLLALMLLGAGCLPGCLPAGEPPDLTDGVLPASCGNGRCEPGQGEECVNCPGDCSCCTGVDAQGRVPLGQDLLAANGAPDGKLIELDPLADLQIALGRELYDVPDQPDLQLHGAVSGGGAGGGAGGCGSRSARTAAFEVTVSLDGQHWAPIGFWAQATGAAAFDLACARLARVRFVRVRGTSGARGQLDAVSAFTDAAGRQPSCDPRGLAGDGGPR